MTYEKGEMDVGESEYFRNEKPTKIKIPCLVKSLNMMNKHSAFIVMYTIRINSHLLK